MMQLIPFEVAHIRSMQNYAGQETLVFSVSDQALQELKDQSDAVTAVKDNVILGCGGVVRVNQWRCMAWGLAQRTEPRNFILVHSAVKKFLRKQPYCRIEAFVDPMNISALRWIELLGFKMERAYIPYFFPNGTGASAWAMMK